MRSNLNTIMTNINDVWQEIYTPKSLEYIKELIKKERYRDRWKKK